MVMKDIYVRGCQGCMDCLVYGDPEVRPLIVLVSVSSEIEEEVVHGGKVETEKHKNVTVRRNPRIQGDSHLGNNRIIPMLPRNP